jgi:methyltransferase (TIGR00027 family)
LKSADERICYDLFAEKFLEDNWNPLGGFPLPRTISFWLFELASPGWNGYFVARTRFIDEALQANLNRGLQQLVIMGAGYDSRAYRFEQQLKDSVAVFEVDHPATQIFKLTKLKEIFGVQPKHVQFVPVDFSTDSLQRRLSESGFDPNRRTMFIWEGVSMYLPADAVEKTLTFVAHSFKGNWLVFDYTFPAVIDGTYADRSATVWRKAAKRYGEELLFGVEEGGIQVFLGRRGFSLIETANHQSLKQRYFKGANESRIVSPAIELVHAQVE